MDVLNKLYAPIRWLITKENKAGTMSEPAKDVINEQQTTADQLSNAQQLSENDDIYRFAANLKKILIASGYDVDIIFDDAVSIAKKI